MHESVVGFLLSYGLGLLGQTQRQTIQDELNQQLFPGAKLPPQYQFVFPYPFQRLFGECIY